MDDFGRQGGDPARLAAAGLRVDLSTCVNFYGPPPEALAALALVGPHDLQLHPYEAAAAVRAAYAADLGVPAAQLVAGRGTTEFIWALGRQVPHAGVAVPLPAYTDYLKAFPGRGFSRRPDEQVPTAGLLDAAAAAGARLVLASNPHNPSGTAIPPEELVDLARRRPATTFVVDESYVDFLPCPAAGSVVGAAYAEGLPNLVVLRSPSKFYGIAATRAGAAWCADPARLAGLLGRQETWPVSGLDARVGAAALAAVEWAAGARRRLAADAAWLADELTRAGVRVVRERVDVHYRCVLTADPTALADAFAREGVGVRVLGAAHGVRPGAVRILAPRPHERAAVAAALARLPVPAGSR